MRYRTKDGKVLPTVQQGRKYDRSLTDKAKERLQNAPTGDPHAQALFDHGPPTKVTVFREGPGRHRVIAIHPDGHKEESVHPEAYRAFQMAQAAAGVEAPPAIQTHARARSHPIGEKESDRIAREDSRDEEEAT
jgi:hypothetical protein